MKQDVEGEIWQWLDTIVIGLNLCPFAKKPRVQQQIRLTLCDARKDKAVLNQLKQAVLELIETPADTTDTTLFVLTQHGYDFYDYLDLLDKAQTLFDTEGFTGQFQLASFHPEYVFDGAAANDRENYTNRAPYPIFHILREESLSRAVDKFPDPEGIPETNIETLETLSDVEFQRLFR